jgi:hypothetical protein
MEYIKKYLRSMKKFLTRKLAKKIFEVKFISNDFGFGRGVPVDRYYIDKFFSENSNLIVGNCLEFGDSAYLDKYGTAVTEKIIFNYSSTPHISGSNITGDITKLTSLPKDEFDCIVCINVLNFIYDLPQALLGLKHMLKLDGKILLTMAGVASHISRYDMNRWGDYWRVTDKAAVKLLEESGFKIELMKVFGNPYACTAQINGFCVEDINTSELIPAHQDYQLLIAFILSK